MARLSLALVLLATPAAAAEYGFFSLRNTDFVVLLAFLLFVGVLLYFRVPRRVAEMLDGRSESIRQELAEARALRLPQTAIESSLRFDDRGSQPGVETTQTTDFDVAAAASWDVDLFGRLRSARAAATT